MSESILANLARRRVYNLNGIILGDDCCYFLLYNLSGQITGVQRYSPTGTKVSHSVERARKIAGNPNGIKYVTYVSPGQIGVYGLQTYNIHSPIYITEGIFDCIMLHNLGLSAIAVLTNDCKPFKSWLKTLPNHKIVIEDNDITGKKLRKFGNQYLICPDPYKDLNEMPENLIKNMIYEKNDA